MQSAEAGNASGLTRRLDGAAERRILGQSEMCPVAVIVSRVRARHVLPMRLVEYDQMIEVLATERSNHARRISILAGTARRNWSVADTHGAKMLLKWFAIRRISVTDEIPWCRVPW